MWMVATQDALDPGVEGVVRQECQGHTGSSLRRLNGRNDVCAVAEDLQREETAGQRED